MPSVCRLEWKASTICKDATERICVAKEGINRWQNTRDRLQAARRSRNGKLLTLAQDDSQGKPPGGEAPAQFICQFIKWYKAVESAQKKVTKSNVRPSPFKSALISLFVNQVSQFLHSFPSLLIMSLNCALLSLCVDQV
jgi:hypothetical protein